MSAKSQNPTVSRKTKQRKSICAAAANAWEANILWEIHLSFTPGLYPRISIT